MILTPQCRRCSYPPPLVRLPGLARMPPVSRKAGSGQGSQVSHKTHRSGPVDVAHKNPTDKRLPAAHGGTAAKWRLLKFPCREAGHFQACRQEGEEASPVLRLVGGPRLPPPAHRIPPVPSGSSGQLAGPPGRLGHRVTETDLARRHGTGSKAIAQFRDALAAAGLSFAAEN